MPRWRDYCFCEARKRAELSRLAISNSKSYLAYPFVSSGLRGMSKIGLALACIPLGSVYPFESCTGRETLKERKF